MTSNVLPFPTQEDNPEHPDDSQGQYGKNNRNLPDDLQQCLKDLTTQFMGQEKFEWRRDVWQDRLHRLFETGVQHVFQNPSTGFFQQAQSGALITLGGGQSYQCATNVRDYNIFEPSERILLAALTQADPQIVFEPNNKARSQDVQAKETAEKYREIYKRNNDTKTAQMQMGRMMGLSGRTWAWTRTEADAAMWGTNAKTGEPNRRERTTIGGMLESKCSTYAKGFEKCNYFIIFEDPDINTARCEYQWLADEGKLENGQPGIGETTYARYARLCVMQGGRNNVQIGEAVSHLITRMHVFLRPDCWYDPKCEDYRETLQELFPTGAHVVFVGDNYAESWEECPDDVLTVGFPYPGDGMSRMAFMAPAVPIQEDFNRDMNAIAQVKEYCWPSVWIHASETEYDAILQQISEPGAIRLHKEKPKGEPLSNSFFQEQPLTIPPTFMENMEWESGALLQFILGTLPSLFGGDSADNKTASGIAQQRGTALGQLGIIWGNQQAMWARIYKQAAVLAAKNPDYTEEDLTIVTDNATEVLDLSAITKSRFLVTADADAGFPESTAAKRSSFQSFMTVAFQTPVGMEVLNSPANFKTAAERYGVTDLEFPQIEAMDKQSREIEDLLNGVPIPPQPEEVQMVMQQAMAQYQQAITAQTQHAAGTLVSRETGAQPPPLPPQAPPPPNVQQITQALTTSSVAVQLLDFHQYEFEVCREWLSSEEVAKQMQPSEKFPQGNAAGVQNVRLHAMEHLKMQAQLQAVLAPMMPPPPPQGAPAAAKKQLPSGQHQPHSQPNANGPQPAANQPTM
jgi:hypothetical protein